LKSRSVALLGVGLVLLLLWRFLPPDERVPASVPDTRAAAPARSATRAAPRTGAQFDFYLLALTVHRAFCRDGHDRQQECKKGGYAAGHPLVLHGLWPEDETPGHYPRDCGKDPMPLSDDLTNKLVEWMPGARSGLATHEWRKHGTCTPLAAERYFDVAVVRTQELARALAPALHVKEPREVTAQDLRAAANAHSPGLGDSFVFQCRTLAEPPGGLFGRPFLIEVRQCIDDDGANREPGTLLSCASVRRRDQGCGKSFWLAPARS
jgi:ribonuclease I